MMLKYHQSLKEFQINFPLRILHLPLKDKELLQYYAQVSRFRDPQLYYYFYWLIKVNIDYLMAYIHI